MAEGTPKKANSYKVVRKEVPGIRVIHFLDDEFAGDTDWIMDFCLRYKKEINLPFWRSYHPFGINDQTIKQLKHAGLQHVVVGPRQVRRVQERKYFTVPNLIALSQEMFLYLPY